MRKIAFIVLLLFSLLACRQTIPFATPEVGVDPSTATLTADTATATPTYENCFWNWAYGEGSPEFDAAVVEQLTAEGIQATVTSTSYGETYSCDNSYHAKDLDVKVEIQAADLTDLPTLAAMVEIIYPLLREKLSITDISGLGNVQLTFVSADGVSTCYWDLTLNKCQP